MTKYAIRSHPSQTRLLQLPLLYAEAAADSLISAMTDNSDAFTPETTPNPVLRRLYKTIQARALDPEAPIWADDAEGIADALLVSETITKASAPAVRTFREAFGLRLEKVEKSGALKEQVVFGLFRPLTAFPRRFCPPGRRRLNSLKCPLSSGLCPR